LRGISIIPLVGIPLVERGNDIFDMILGALKNSKEIVKNSDILVISHKIISKAEGSMVDLEKVRPSKEALALADEVGKDPKVVHVILEESKRIVRKHYDRLIVEHKRGWICANAGVDFSNVPGDFVALLPKNPDSTAEEIRQRIRERLDVEVAVMIIDSQGRPFRKGIVGVALGYSGMQGLVDRAGGEDLYNYKLRNTTVALADQIASAASLVMGEGNEGIPAVIVRGLVLGDKYDCGKDLIRGEGEDLFR